MIKTDFPAQGSKIGPAEIFLPGHPVKGTVGAEAFAKRNVQVEQPRPLIRADGQDRGAVILEIDCPGKAPAGQEADYVFDQGSLGQN
jgi:hypothetical protein